MQSQELAQELVRIKHLLGQQRCKHQLAFSVCSDCILEQFVVQVAMLRGMLVASSGLLQEMLLAWPDRCETPECTAPSMLVTEQRQGTERFEVGLCDAHAVGIPPRKREELEGADVLRRALRFLQNPELALAPPSQAPAQETHGP